MLRKHSEMYLCPLVTALIWWDPESESAGLTEAIINWPYWSVWSWDRGRCRTAFLWFLQNLSVVPIVLAHAVGRIHRGQCIGDDPRAVLSMSPSSPFCNLHLPPGTTYWALCLVGLPTRPWVWCVNSTEGWQGWMEHFYHLTTFGGKNLIHRIWNYQS